MLFLLSLVALTAGAYNDPVARFKFFPMSAAAYTANPTTCIQNAFTNGTLKRQVEVHCDITLKDKCSGFTAVSHSDQAVIVSYRGTNRNFQLIMEGDETILKNHTAWIAGGVVSEYFDNGFSRLWKQGMKDDFTTLINKFPNYQVWVTGHSLGGAMAVLGASYIVHTKLVPADKLTLITFGEPRVGDSAFASSVDNEVKNSFRVTHDRDMVPHLPLKNEEGYHHHKTEIYYKKDMAPGAKYTVCMGDESMLCSDGNIIDASINDHLTYFNVDIDSFSNKGCKY